MKVTNIPVVIGAFGSVTKVLLKGREVFEVEGWVETIQTAALLRTARILRKVLQTSVKNHQLMLMLKTRKEYIMIITIISVLNEQIYAGAKLICEKIWIPLKSTKKKIKTRTENANLRKLDKMMKQRKDDVIRRNKKEKSTREKNKSTIQGYKTKITDERRKI